MSANHASLYSQRLLLKLLILFKTCPFSLLTDPILYFMLCLIKRSSQPSIYAQSFRRVTIQQSFLFVVFRFFSQVTTLLSPYLISHARFHFLISHYDFLMIFFDVFPALFLEDGIFHFCILCHNYKRWSTRSSWSCPSRVRMYFLNQMI